uniref:Tuftelin-interacting protein 11 n=1 Tax=Rhipicephalus zambeziensis TaxID=60191 RepID=A0A224Z2P8_9ACAR
MADVEIENFEITDWDIANEFNINRVRRRPTKNQQIYGIWADSDDEGDARPSFQSSKKHKDFSAPISFVSGGVRQVGKQEEKKEEGSEDEHASSSEEEVKVPAKTMKTGFAGGRGGIAHGLLGAEGGFGNWEKYTKGIGAKLLLQMGYQPGRGLGRDLQGISAPIEAKVRKGKGAIGLYGPETKGPKLMTSEVATEDSTSRKGARPELNQWRKRKEGEKKVTYVYKTIDEVKSEGVYKKPPTGPQSKLSKVKVIDMTGPEQRVLSGYHELHQQHSRPDEREEIELKRAVGSQFSVPELTNNLELLVNMTEQQIVQNDRDAKHEEDRTINLRHELDRLEELITTEEKQERRLAKLSELVQTMVDRSQEDHVEPLTLEDCATMFHTLQDEFYEEYKMYGLSDLAITLLCPMVKKELESWSPLKDRDAHVSLFCRWRDLLEIYGSRTHDHRNAPEDDPYHYLVWETWMPPVRQAILDWSPRDCDPLIELLETWMPLLPRWMLENILDQFVLIKLQTEVEAWNPLTDTMPIHSWLHPWLPLMGLRLEPLYPPIRLKLANALSAWHPSDGSAKLILEPWRGVFSQGTLEAFVVANILPKLALALQAMPINPHQQHLDVWQWVMAWEDLCPASSMATLLEKTFFPQWLQVLAGWLQHNPNYQEISKWYTGWKSLFSDALLQQTSVREQFKVALDMMNRAVSGLPVVPPGPGAGQQAPPGLLGYRPAPPPPQHMPQEAAGGRPEYSHMQTIRTSTTPANAQMTFKELIEQRAQEKNLLFVPMAHRFQEGKQVYRLGHVMLYLDRNVIFVFNGKTWVPTSLQSLLDMAG